jgi:phage-related protein
LVGREIVILHSFIKKTQETPDSEMRIARKRLQGVKNA